MELGRSIQGFSIPESLRGSLCVLTILPSVLPVTHLHASCGLHRFEPVEWTGSLPPRAMSLTRQGISLTLLLHGIATIGAGHFCRLLHIAMQVGLYLHQRSSLDSGVQSLRILDTESSLSC
jgi:hypothetical protein